MFAIKWFLGLGRTKKTIMSVLVVPLVLLLVILILEKLLKLTWRVGDILFNAISHVFSKENRSAYIITVVGALLLGGYLEYSHGFITYVIDLWQYIVDKYNYIVEYVQILIQF